MEKPVYRVDEVAELLGVSKGTVYELIRAGRIPHKRIGRRIAIPRVLFMEWLNTPDPWESYDVPRRREVRP